MSALASGAAPVRTVVVVEDEPSIASAVAARLRSEGLHVEIAADGLEGVALCERVHPSLVVLDLMLPGIDGLEVCRRIQRTRPVPVLMLTAKDSESDLITGLRVGGDDYLTKPFSSRELVARVHALLRRAERTGDDAVGPRDHATRSGPGGRVQLGSITLDVTARRVHDGDRPVHLTPTEFDLVVHLGSAPERVFTREELLAEVWGYEDGAGARTVDSHVRAVRRKLGGGIVRTVHGIGYGAGDGTGRDDEAEPSS